MRVKTALKLSAYYHVLAFGATLLGGALVAAGVFLGFQGALSAVASQPPGAQMLTALLGAVSPVPLVALGAAGVVVRRIGRTAARLNAHARAADEQIDTASTSVISRKVAREVSTTVEEQGSEFGRGSSPATAADAEPPAEAPPTGTDVDSTTEVGSGQSTPAVEGDVDASENGNDG
ncbi:MAG: hypothetical protein ABEJ79_03145 [Halolamina sp.]